MSRRLRLAHQLRKGQPIGGGTRLEAGQGQCAPVRVRLSFLPLDGGWRQGGELALKAGPGLETRGFESFILRVTHAPVAQSVRAADS